MRIQLYDRGSLRGKKLFEDLLQVCHRLQIDYDPEYIKDMGRIYSKGYSGETILMVDNEVAFIDKYPGRQELENIISDFLK